MTLAAKRRGVPGVKRRVDSWLGATVDTVMAVSALAVVWYPAIRYANALVGSPLGEVGVASAVGGLAVGTAYPFVTGGLSLGDLGEFLVLFLLVGVGWGLAIGALGASPSGSTPVQRGVVWALAYLTAYVVAFRTEIVVVR